MVRARELHGDNNVSPSSTFSPLSRNFYVVGRLNEYFRRLSES